MNADSGFSLCLSYSLHLFQNITLMQNYREYYLRYGMHECVINTSKKQRSGSL